MRHGTRIGTNSLGTLRTGTNIAGTVPGQKSLGQPNPKLWDKSGPSGSPVQCPSLELRGFWC